MPILVEYACRSCGTRQETWSGQAIPVTMPCQTCGEPARRTFGAALLRTAGRAGDRARGGGRQPGPGSGHSHGVPGSCVLQPTAARMLEARIKGDRRAIERETAQQEKAISEGRLDPRRLPVLAYPGQPVSA